MDALQSVVASFSPLGLRASRAVDSTSASFSLAANLLGDGLFGQQSSTFVDLSGTGQILSAVASFQDQLQRLRPGSAGSGIGRNLGSDVTSFAAEAQFVVDAFNGVQDALAGTGGGARSDALVATFTRALADAARTASSDGDPTLAQIGIEFQPAAFGGGRLSIDFDKLKSAFASDGAAAFSLLGKAAQAFGEVAADTVGQAQDVFSKEAVLAQSGLFGQTPGLFSLFPAADGSSLANQLLLESLLGSGAGSTAALQNLVAFNEFNLISSLLG